MRYSEGYKYITRAREVYRCLHVVPGVGAAIYTDGGRLVAQLSASGVLTIEERYAYDGASGPTIDTRNSMRGSLYHDVFFEMMRAGVLDRKWFDAANQELRDVCRADGMSTYRSWLWYKCVGTKVAYQSTLAKNAPAIITAP